MSCYYETYSSVFCTDITQDKVVEEVVEIVDIHCIVFDFIQLIDDRIDHFVAFLDFYRNLTFIQADVAWSIPIHADIILLL